MDFRTVRWVNLALLGLLAVGLLALAAGASVPRPAFAGLILARAGVQAFRDLRWGGEAGRRRVGFNLLLSALLAWLILRT